MLRGNTIIPKSTNLSRNTGCDLQGIGMFDGTYKDWIIENNVVVTSHWHGIAVYGANNVKVINNTAINPYGSHETWIKIVNHKNGTPSVNSVVRNCLAVSFPSRGSGVIYDHNLIITRANLADNFVNPNAFDFRLKAGSLAIDTGSANLAPSVDRDGSARPAGAGFDFSAIDSALCFHLLHWLRRWRHSLHLLDSWSAGTPVGSFLGTSRCKIRRSRAELRIARLGRFRGMPGIVKVNCGGQ